MFLSRKIEGEIKKLIIEGFGKEDIIEKVTRDNGPIRGLSFFYDCCYNTICKEMGINRKKGEELKPTKTMIHLKRRGNE